MTWSYTGNPADSMKDAVRFLINDTDTNDQLLSNEEIQWCISQAGDSVYQSAHDACYAIASHFSRMATSKSVGDMSITYTNRAQSYFDLANELLELGARRNPPTPWASEDNMKRASDKTVPPSNGTEYWTGQMDYERGNYWRNTP